MSYQLKGDLTLTYSPGRIWNVVLDVHDDTGPYSSVHATLDITPATSRYAAEWLDRLTPCDPDALHLLLANKDDAAKLWHPCVYDDPDSPSAVAGDGCVCWQTYRDPETYLPVNAHHYRTVTGNVEHWTYYTYAPLALPADERLFTLIIDREAGAFWVRTRNSTLHLLPQAKGAGYGCGYQGSGSLELARMIEKLVNSDGADLTAGTPNQPPGKRVFAWVKSAAADRTQELDLDQLRTLCRTGMVG